MLRPAAARVAFVASVLCAACASPGTAPSSTNETSASEKSATVLSPAEAAPTASASASAISSADPAPPAIPKAPRVYAKTRFVWVHYEPSAASGWLGYLWIGGSAELADDKPIANAAGCKAWYAVKPRGFVCADGDSATLDENDPVLVAMKPYAPDLTSPWPHHYGESRGAERYEKLPTPEERRAREWDLTQHEQEIADAANGKLAASLLGVDLGKGSDAPFEMPAIPSTMREQRRRMTPLSTVAWSRDLEHDERGFLLTADFAYVPKDRVAPYPVSKFHGTELGSSIQLPVAFFRERARPKYRIGEDGIATATGESWDRHALVQLTGASKKLDEKTYWETKEDGLFTDGSDATIVRGAEKTPWGADVGVVDPRATPGRHTWIEVSILGGWLVAYEGTKPVYVTLISPGRGGVPLRDKDPLVTASTPIGAWPISGKFATATMVAPGEFIHSDVPWTQNFHGPHALHGAYWHDGWGEKKSAGCVNVSPIDGKWLFEWTDPPLPEGWHGIRLEPEHDASTTFVVHS